MSTSAAYSWDRVRQGFADQFEQDGTNFVYRRSQKGAAIRVSAEERSRFVEEFDRNVRRAKWIIYISLTLVFGAIIGFSMLRGSDLSRAAIFVGIGLAMIPYFAFFRWAWSAPVRDLGSRTPIAGERSPGEVRRLRFQRITYGQLAGVSFGGVMIPFLGSSRQDVFSGWNRLWLVVGGALVLLAAVQAFRKWRFEQEDSYRSIIPRFSARDITQPAQDATPPTKNQVWRYLPLAVILLGFGFIAYTPAGKQLAKQPSFWPILMIGLGVWSLFTVAQGFTKGQIEPFARGFYNTYQRETQPKRFWASMTWNALFGCFFLWFGFTMNRDATAQSLRDRCYNGGHNYQPKDVLPACTQLISGKASLGGWSRADVFVERGIAYARLGRFDEAISDFTQSHELEPKNAWPLANRGLAYAWKRDMPHAKQDFAAVRAIDPANRILLRGEGLMDMFEGDLDAAIDRFTAALTQDPSDVWSLQMRADAYQQMGDFDKARNDRGKLNQLRKGAKVPRPAA